MQPRQKKILHVVFNLNEYSGAAFQAATLAGGLSDDFSYRIFSIENRSTSFVQDGVVEFAPKKSLLWVFHLIRSVRQADIVHMHGFSLPAMIVASLMCKVIILKTTLQGSDDFLSLRYSYAGILKIFLLRFVRINVVLSDSLMDINKHFFSEKKILKIPNGVILHETPEKKTKPVFCTVGVISERKGILDAILFFERNFSHMPDACMYVVGPIPDEGSSEGEGSYEYYKACCQAAGKNVHFTGMLNKEALQSVYAKCLGFIFFSKREGMPNVLLEAMAHNCIPIISDMGGVGNEVVEHGVDGYVYDDFGAGKSCSIDDILRLSEKYKAWEKIKFTYAISVIRNRYMKIYLSL